MTKKRTVKKYTLLFIMLMLFITRVFSLDIARNFHAGIAQLMQFYDSKIALWQDSNCIKSGSCKGHGFWYWANTERIIADYQLLTGESTNEQAMYQTMQRNREDIINVAYFDDEGWWALAFVAAYRATHNIDYLYTAEDIVNDITQRGAQHVCGNGGVYWSAKKTQVGSIANELYIRINANLYMITHDKRYKRNANAAWDWFKNSGLISSDFIVADHYSVKDGKCGEMIKWHFTYTNGVLLGVLADLAQINHDPKLMNQAKEVARRSMYDYSLGGVLTEPCTNVSACADDAFMFKGIFVHELAYLALAANDGNFINDVRDYLRNNYSKLVANQGESGLYAFSWSLPVDFNSDSILYNPSDVVTQLSALYLMDANLMMGDNRFAKLPPLPAGSYVKRVINEIYVPRPQKVHPLKIHSKIE
ncbi:MAG: hypothetical protein QG673_2323 [Pseudomonadota bacterium]|nr:hypothetical protein [Pseudomonadota bacterium]